MESFLKDRLTLVAVLGAGVVVGISGLYMYFNYTKCVTRELTHLTRTIEHLRKDIEELKAASKTRAASLRRTGSERSIGNASTALGGAGSYDDNEEYYDVSDDANTSWTSVDGDFVSTSENLTTFFEENDKLLTGDHQDRLEAYGNFILKKDENNTNPDFLWRLSKACNLLSTTENDNERKKELIFDGIKYASLALTFDENNGECHKWYAISIGKATDYVCVQEKIKNGHSLIKHVNQAIQLNPQDHTLYFLKGRWCYGVALLSWVERKVASALFGDAPTSTFVEAREQFMEVEKLKPEQWKENLFYIAKCLIEERNYAEAIKWLDKASKLPCITGEDSVVHDEVLSLQTKYKSYRKM